MEIAIIRLPTWLEMFENGREVPGDNLWSIPILDIRIVCLMPEKKLICTRQFYV